jgi:cytokinin riboside 5'-monophosphate phosphoribohydrolase
VKVCVFCSSSDRVDQRYRDAAEELGRALARAGHGLVYGGSRVGLMGIVARAALQEGAEVVGVIPEFMQRRALAAEGAVRMLVTSGMRERKAQMDALADAFVALPGGFGTCEEILEALTLRGLARHDKAVVFVNIGGFYDSLLAFFDRMYEESFAREETRALYHVATTVQAALDYLADYRPAAVPDKWHGAAG